MVSEAVWSQSTGRSVNIVATMLRLKDGKRDVVSRDRHFIDLPREYMGDDAGEFYEDRIKSILDLVDEAKGVIGSQPKRGIIGEGILDILNEVKYE